jgi:hypothetical protein
LASGGHWIDDRGAWRCGAWRRGAWYLGGVELRELECLSREVAQRESIKAAVTRQGNDVVLSLLPDGKAHVVHDSAGWRVSTPITEGRGERRENQGRWWYSVAHTWRRGGVTRDPGKT